jgi:hypothetical protein
MSGEGPSVEPGPSTTNESGKESKFPLSLKSLGEFFKRLLQLERTVGALKDENRQIRKDLIAIQRQLDEQNGQLEMRMATAAQVEATAKLTAINAVQSILGARSNATSERE